MDLNSKVVLITGSANNIGRAIALKFARERAKIVVNTKKNVSGGNDTARK